jgi:hypothetical protein
MRKITGLLLLSLMSTTQAGFNGLTHAAIVNCPTVDITESVSWDRTKSHWLRVMGQHQGPQGQFNHIKYNYDWKLDGKGWEYTSLCNATCMGDSANYKYYSFSVNTVHQFRSETGKAIMAHSGEFKNCNAYDGWYDQ